MLKGVSDFGQNEYKNPESLSIIQKIVAATAIVSVVGALFHSMHWTLFGHYTFEELFGLSAEGIGQFWLWQPISHLFFEMTTLGLSLTFFIYLLLNLYIISFVGLNIANEVGPRDFLKLYFTSGLLAGGSVLFTNFLLGTDQIFFGNIAPLYMLITLWCMLAPENELLFLFVFTVRLKWLWAALLGVQFLLAIPTRDISGLIAVLSGTMVGYTYGIFQLNLTGPFSYTHSIETRFKNFVSLLFLRPHSQVVVTKAKIYDFKTGEAILNDDQFMDEVLDKISKHGEKSVTWSERQRMEQISRRKRGEFDT
ncbi:MAG: hypothetical protein K0S74_1309 [Chlamydiales bacterium]|jgi:hypothetical protein|nr:hypothetical protein [Chlamydiales bacterium]